MYSAVIVVPAIAAGSLSCHVQINVLLLSLPAAGSRSTREGTASLGVIPCSARWRKFTFRDLCVAVGCCYRFPCCMFCCRHGLIYILLPALLSWLPLVACFVQDHVFLSSGFLLLKNLTQFDQAHILLSLWLPDCRCFTLIIKSMYCCRHCFHSCRWFKITGIHGCGSPTRKGTTALGIVPCSALFRKFTITSAYLLPSWLPKLTLAHIHVQINVLKYTSYRPTC